MENSFIPILQFIDLNYYFSSPLLLLGLAFQIWMFVDAVRHEEYLWAVLIFFFSFITALLYFFLVYRSRSPRDVGFELPGAANRKRIGELEAQIHHLDKAHHYAELGDIHLHAGRWDKAETCYRAALEREPDDLDSRAHLGQALLHKGRVEEALSLLESVCAQEIDHDYGYSQMMLAETYRTQGEREKAMATLKSVLERHGYARARVTLAEMLAERGDHKAAAAQAQEVIQDDAYAPPFQRRRDRLWVRRARKLQ